MDYVRCCVHLVHIVCGCANEMNEKVVNSKGCKVDKGKIA